MDVEPASHGFGLYGEDFGYPGGGLCLSTFLAVRRDDELLVGTMDEAHADRWTEAWAPNLAYYEGGRRAALFEGWRFPATYLQVGEHPRQAARRVFGDQLGFDGEPQLGEPRIVSAAKASRRSPEHEHWDLLFVFDVPGPAVANVPEHWSRLTYEPVEELAADEGVMMHGELVDLLS